MKQRYESAVVCVEALSESVIQAMASLYLDNFDGTSEATFRSDLFEKNDVILLYCEGRLVGFTTLKIFQTSWNGTSVNVVYSGDTIVSQLHWGQQELAFAWISRIGQIKRSAPTSRSSGFFW